MRIRTAATALALSVVGLVGPVAVPAANAATCHMSWKGFPHWHPGFGSNFNIYGRGAFRICGRGAATTARLKFVQGVDDADHKCDIGPSPFGVLKYVTFRFEVPYGSPRAGDRSVYRYVGRVSCRRGVIHYTTKAASTPLPTVRAHDDWNLHMHAVVAHGPDLSKNRYGRILGDL